MSLLLLRFLGHIKQRTLRPKKSVDSWGKVLTCLCVGWSRISGGSCLEVRFDAPKLVLCFGSLKCFIWSVPSSSHFFLSSSSAFVLSFLSFFFFFFFFVVVCLFVCCFKGPIKHSSLRQKGGQCLPWDRLVRFHWRFLYETMISVQFSTVQDGINALGKAHMRSTPSLKSLPNFALETVRNQHLTRQTSLCVCVCVLKIYQMECSFTRTLSRFLEKILVPQITSLQRNSDSQLIFSSRTS